MIPKSEREIEKMLDDVLSVKPQMELAYRGMSYADGVEEALRWSLGQRSDPLFDKGDF